MPHVFRFEQRGVPPEARGLGFQARGWALWDLSVGPPGRPTENELPVTGGMQEDGVDATQEI